MKKIKIKLIIIIFFIVLIFLYLQVKLFNIRLPFQTKALGVNIELNLKLQGDFSKYNNRPIFTKVIVYNPFQKVKEFDNIELIQSDSQRENNNIFTATFTLENIDLNQIYTFFIKPSKYLGRVVSGKVLNEGNNVINLNNEYFFAGDFYPVDGKISASELSLIIKNLGSKESFETDINSDGITDTQDYSLVLYTLKQNFEEETVRLLPTPTPTPTSTPNPTPTPTPTPNQISFFNQQPTNTPRPNNTSPNNLSYCELMKTDLPHAKIRYPNGTTATPSTTNKICAWNRPYYYSLPYRNPNCRVTQAMIDKAYERMKTFYPNYYQNTRIKEEWQIVQELSIKYNFNPLFVISLWIEESAAGGATQAQQLGCLYRLNKDDTHTYLSSSSNICEQMECLFGSRAVVPDNFARWACSYQHGYRNWQNNDCLKVTTFTRTIEFWYNYMSDNGNLLSSDCQIKRYSPCDLGCP